MSGASRRSIATGPILSLSIEPSLGMLSLGLLKLVYCLRLLQHLRQLLNIYKSFTFSSFSPDPHCPMSPNRTAGVLTFFNAPNATPSPTMSGYPPCQTSHPSSSRPDHAASEVRKHLYDGRPLGRRLGAFPASTGHSARQRAIGTPSTLRSVSRRTTAVQTRSPHCIRAVVTCPCGDV